MSDDWGVREGELERQHADRNRQYREVAVRDWLTAVLGNLTDDELCGVGGLYFATQSYAREAPQEPHKLRQITLDFQVPGREGEHWDGEGSPPNYTYTVTIRENEPEPWQPDEP